MLGVHVRAISFPDKFILFQIQNSIAKFFVLLCAIPFFQFEILSSFVQILNVGLLINKNDVMRLGERPRSLEGKPNIKICAWRSDSGEMVQT